MKVTRRTRLARYKPYVVPAGVAAITRKAADALIKYGSRNTDTNNRYARRFMAGTAIPKNYFSNQAAVTGSGPGTIRINGSRFKRATGGTSRSRGQTARSGGFVKTRRFAAKRRTTTGINFTGEFGGTTTNADMVIVGHSTTPGQILYQQVWMAMLKQLLRKGGVDVIDAIKPFEFNGRIVFKWKTTTVSGMSSYVLPIVDATTTLRDLAINFAGTGNGYNDRIVVETAEPFLLIFEPYENGDGTYLVANEAYIRLDESYISAKIKSSLKMQNRSVGSAEDGQEADTVDQVPLYGKSYEGRGNGAWWSNNENYTTTFIASSETGVILPVNAGVIREPPPPKEFKGALRTGKVRIEPGLIKSSVLSDYQNHLFKNWAKQLVLSNYAYNPNVRGGKYRFFCVEKILDADNTGLIKCAFEHNIFINTNMKTRRSIPTVQLFKGVYGLTPT